MRTRAVLKPENEARLDFPPEYGGLGSGYHQIRWWAAQESNLRPPACKIGFAAPRSAANMNESIAYPQHKLARKVPRYPQKPRKTHDFACSAAHLRHRFKIRLSAVTALFMWMVITLSGAHRFSASVCANCPSLEYCQIECSRTISYSRFAAS